jgi:hypothetical protein
MTARLSRNILVLTLFLLYLPIPSEATSQIFVMNNDGVWLASDTLNIHNTQDGVQTRSEICKFVMRRGSVIFNAGSFSDIHKLQEEQMKLQISELDSQDMINNVTNLLLKYHADVPYHDPNASELMTGIVTVKDGAFSAELYFEQEDLAHYDRKPILKFIPGHPHGFGDLVTKTRDAAFYDPALRAKIAANPKKELLQILSDEASEPGSLVGPPYTVLLLHPDGTISDYSDNNVCVVPKDAEYTEPKQQKRRKHN